MKTTRQPPSFHRPVSETTTNTRTPFFACCIPAGFPSPADDYLENQLDLNEYLIHKPSATFFVRTIGDSMKDIGICDGDLLIIDRSRQAKHRSIVLAIVNGEFTLKRLLKRNQKIILKAENANYPDLEIQKEMDFEVWGVVIHAIHSLL